MQNKAVFYFHFDVFIFDNKVAGGGNAIRQAICPVPAAVECPVYIYERLYKSQTKENSKMWNYHPLNYGSELH